MHADGGSTCGSTRCSHSPAVILSLCLYFFTHSLRFECLKSVWFWEIERICLFEHLYTHCFSFLIRSFYDYIYSMVSTSSCSSSCAQSMCQCALTRFPPRLVHVVACVSLSSGNASQCSTSLASYGLR